MSKEKIDCLPKLKKLAWAYDLSWGYTCQTDSEKRSTICSKVFILSRVRNMKPFLITYYDQIVSIFPFKYQIQESRVQPSISSHSKSKYFHYSCNKITTTKIQISRQN